MKKHFLWFLLFTFNLSFLQAQDSLALAKKKNEKKWKPYILISAGQNQPWTFSGYGADSYNNDPEDGYGYSGYATKGYEINATGGFLFGNRGWELTAMVAYIHNGLNASGYLQETISDFFLGQSVIYAQQVIALGNYAYNNFPVLAGITKNWGREGKVKVGLSFLVGDFITFTPALHSIATGLSDNGSMIGPNTVSYYFNMNSEIQSNLMYELDFHLDVSITRHIFIRAACVFGFSGLTNSGGYQFVDMSTGNTVHSGNYSAVGQNYNSFFVGFTNLAGGIGYKF